MGSEKWMQSGVAQMRREEWRRGVERDGRREQGVAVCTEGSHRLILQIDIHSDKT